MRTVKIWATVVLLLSLAGSASAGLVAHYQFEGNTQDSSGNGLHGVLVGAATLAGDGERGKVLSLDGGHVDCGTDARFNTSSAITVASWIKVRTFNKAWQAIVTKGDYAWRLQRDNTSSGIEFACTGANVPGTTWGNILGRTNVNDGKWHHVAGVFTGAKICLYVDGVLDRSDTATGTIGSNAWAVWIGANAQVAGREWAGLVDDVRIYNNALSAAEVAALAGVTGTRQVGQGGGLAVLASAFIDATGKVMSGTPNVTCTLTSGWKYEITILGETYTASQYVTAVTPSQGTVKMAADSANGKLVVSARDPAGDTVKTAFQFVTYKPNPLPDRPADWGKVVEVKTADFDRVVLGSDLPVFVFFYATWSGYCTQMVPIVDELAIDYAGRARFCKVDVDYAPTINARYGITAIPTFITFKGGQMKQKLVGTRTKSQLAAVIDPLLTPSVPSPPTPAPAPAVDQPIITRVVRANGESDNRAPIGQYNGNTAVLPTQAGGLKDGNLCYSDRTYPWVKTPARLVGAEYVRTFNSDKKSTTVTYTVTTSRKATVMITVDDRIVGQQGVVDLATMRFAPAGTFVDTRVDLFIHEDDVTNRPISVFSAELAAGTYVFGPMPSVHTFYVIAAMD